MLGLCLQSFRKVVSFLDLITRMPENSDTRSLADVMADWRRPQGRLRFSWLRMVRADLDLIDTSLEGAISFAEDRTVLSRMIDGIANYATIAMHE